MKEKYGNGTHTEYSYDPARRWLKTIKTQNKGGNQFQNMSYEFDPVGNVKGYENDCLDGGRGNYKTCQNYEYDGLYQLTRATGETTYNPYKSPVPEFISTYNQAFEFDSDGLGNMMKKVSSETVTPRKTIGDNLNYTFDYEYDENYAHRLIHAGNLYYQYDANGNVTCEQDGSFESNGDDGKYHKISEEAEGVYSNDYGWGLFRDSDSAKTSSRYHRTYTWNERNQLICSKDASFTTNYIYGQDGQRTNKYTARSETLYFNKMWTLHTDSGNSVYGGQNAKNIYLGDTRIVTKLASPRENTIHEEYYKQYYYHSDHLGSASLISDYKGDEYQRIEYTPYGETWVEKTQNTGLEYLPYKFTGQMKDEETGNYYIGARYLCPRTCRWLSCDPAVGEYLTPDDNKQYGAFDYVNLNLYHYGHNNPLKYKDPSGEKDIFSYFYDMCAMSYGSKGADYIMKNDTSVQVATTIDAAAKGDPKAQQILADATKEGLKQTAVEGLEVTADVAGFVSEATGDMALAAVVVQPGVAGGLGTASDISSGIEVGARGLKAAITKDPKDFEKAKKTGIKNVASWFVGFSLGKPAKKISDEASTAIGGMSSKITEKIIDSVEKNHKED